MNKKYICAWALLVFIVYFLILFIGAKIFSDIFESFTFLSFGEIVETFPPKDIFIKR